MAFLTVWIKTTRKDLVSFVKGQRYARFAINLVYLAKYSSQTNYPTPVFTVCFRPNQLPI